MIQYEGLQERDVHALHIHSKVNALLLKAWKREMQVMNVMGMQAYGIHAPAYLANACEQASLLAFKRSPHCCVQGCFLMHAPNLRPPCARIMCCLLDSGINTSATSICRCSPCMAKARLDSIALLLSCIADEHLQLLSKYVMLCEVMQYLLQWHCPGLQYSPQHHGC